MELNNNNNDFAITDDVVLPFVVGGTLFTSITLLSNYVSVKWAAIITSINLSLAATIFIKDKGKILGFAWNETILMLVVAVMTIIYYLMYKYTDEMIMSLVIANLVFVVLVFYLYDTVMVETT
jgi:hypothetical protein